MHYFLATSRRGRPLAVLSTLLLLGPWAQAQIISNGSFNNNATCVTNNNVTPFASNCVPGWSPSHGSPQIKGANPNAYAYMWSVGNPGSGGTPAGEGIYTPLTVTANQRYQLTFWARNADGSNPAPPVLGVQVTGNLVPSGAGGLPTNARPGGLVGQPTLSTTWTQYTVQFNGPTWTNPQLWFYPLFANTRYDVNVDSIKVTGCVVDDVYYQNLPSLTGLTRTQGRIFAGRMVNPAATQGPVTVSQTTSFRSLREISLQDGLSVPAGTEFEAIMLPCAGFNNSRPSEAPDNLSASTAADAGSSAKGAAAYPIRDPCNCLGVATNARLANVVPAPSYPADAGNYSKLSPAQDSLVVSAGLVLAPNPTAGSMEFRPEKSSARAPGLFHVYNKEGQEVRVLDCKGLPQREDAFVLDVSFLANGIYHYRYVSGAQVESGHFVVKK